jgi:uncharacterized protein (UPF0335 family)
MTNSPFDENDDPEDAADRARGKNDRDTTHIDKDAKFQLAAFVTRIERMEEEKKAIADDIKEIYAEAKGTGFDTKILREAIRRRKMDRAERDEHDALLALYEGVFG